jgi:hypothetical protein
MKRPVRTIVEAPVIVIEDVERFDGYDSLRTMKDAVEMSKEKSDMWRSETYSITRGLSGKIFVLEGTPYEDDPEDEIDGLFEFTKEAAEAFVNHWDEEIQAKVDQGRKLRVISSGPMSSGWMIGRAPCGSYFRISRKEAKAVGKAVLKEWYAEPEAAKS